MKVYGVDITDAQLASGRAAMEGQFTAGDVMGAMMRAGVPMHDWVANRAADRLLQKERKAGRIRAISNKAWERVG